jgi:phosphoribosylformylglycinamidine synthase
MAIGNKIGAKIDGLEREDMTGLRYGDMLVEMPAETDVAAAFDTVNHVLLGTTQEEEKIVFEFGEITEEYGLDDIIRRWEKPLEEVFPTRTADHKTEKEPNVENISFTQRPGNGPAIKVARPKVVIPVLPGTNCEVDSKRAFEAAGADVSIQIINNLSELDLIESINQMSNKIKESQIIMLPGGFSGGDEPDGSAKFMTAVFRNPLISEAVRDLLDNRDGLMLGICNGFQALVKLGLLPFGEIREPSEHMATLTYNDIGRHQSKLIRTRIASVKSPWMSLCDVDDVHTIAISHGEGKFVAPDDILEDMIKNGQVAAQYVDFEGNAAMDIDFNPNHSVMAIEAVTSPDGRIMGKMAHSERWCENVFKNVPGNKEQKIFEAGVNYFK